MMARMLGWPLLAALAACGREPASPAVTGQPASQEPATPVAPEPPAATPPPAAPAAALPPAAPASEPGFAVYTATATLLIPVDATRDTAQAPGLWLLGEHAGAAQVKLLFTRSDAGPCACSERACTVDVPQIVDLNSSDPICDCVAPGPADDSEPDPDDPEAEEPCAESSLAPVSLLGGGLYWLGDAHSLCGGFNQYDAVDSYTTIFATPEPTKPVSFTRRDCDPETGPGEPPPAWPLGDLRCRAAGKLWALADSLDEPGDDEGPPAPPSAAPECDECKDSRPETSIWLLRRGELLHVEDNIFHAGGQRWVTRQPAPGRCPDPQDPCGDPALFPGLAAAPDFWVASDHSAALISDKAGLHVRPQGAPSTRRADDPGPLLGVKFHHDLGPLRAAQRRAPGPHSGDGPCRDDATCRRRLGCDALCDPKGACVTARPGTCDDAHPCRGDARCEAGRCRVTAVLLPEDAALNERGKGLGDRCLAHLKADRFAAARGACEAALTHATSDAARGALHYNLGRVAEAIGDLDEARARYRESLALRDNPTVAQALARVAD